MQAKPNTLFTCLIALCTLTNFCLNREVKAETLFSDGKEWSVETQLLDITCTIDEKPTPLLRVFDAETTSQSLQEQRKGLTFSAEPAAVGGLKLTIRSEKPRSLQLSLPTYDRYNQKVIWPRGNGLLFPAHGPFWQKEIFGQEWDVGESLSIPAWGSIADGRTISMFTTTPYRTAISFEKSHGADNNYGATVDLDFSEMAPSMEATLYLFVDAGENPLAPAQHYRRWLQETRKLITLEAKARETTSTELLRGAAHVYLWGDDAVSGEDIPRNKWSDFCKTLARDGNTSGSVAHYLKSFFAAEEWKAVEEGAAAEWPYDYVKNLVAAGLSRAVTSPGFASGFQWPAQGKPQSSDALISAQLLAENGNLLSGAFPGTFLPDEQWGNGASLKMFDALSSAGLDRLKLCTPGHETLAWRPWLAQEAAERGWLLGTYDSYHSIHSPTTPPDKTWSTALMTAELYENGAVRKKNGDFYQGFQGVGRKLNSVFGRLFMEDRVARNMAEVPYNYYFMDCDATGEFFDDYSPLHPLGKEADAAERKRRLTWISKKFNSVVGSEGGNADFAQSIHVAEGVFEPFFGWDEPAMKDPKSPYYRGRYYPPSAPDVFFKPAPLNARFQKLFFDPATRIPLYQAALHDSVVATAHWNNAHFKWSDAQTTQALTEILFLAPPMYHLNLAEFAKRKEAIVRHYKIWSPLHKAYGFAPLTSFRWLDDKGLVQETRFGDDCRIVANFSDTAVQVDGQELPGSSVLIDAPKVWDHSKVYSTAKD